jgi:hypothetical protein
VAPSASSGQALQAAGLFWRTLVSLLAAFGVYSAYIAFHEPDPQETVLLGQTRICADSPAGWRIVVRDRVNLRPVARAAVELSLDGPLRLADGKPGGSAALGVFRTGAGGSLTNHIQIPALPPGSYTLVVNTRSHLGSDRIRRTVEVIHPARVSAGSGCSHAFAQESLRHACVELTFAPRSARPITRGRLRVRPRS